MEKVLLQTEKAIDVRFSEVDLMGVVWHGSYMMYLEDAREEFGTRFGLSYCRYIEENVMVPVVEMNLKYRKPVKYGMKPVVRISYVPTDAAKIIFDYEIYDSETGDVCLTARSIQVFMDTDYNLLWFSPGFYEDWKRRMGV
ncbi:MAG: acyl-CoA thioesterase [Bacteroidales bacterium]|nr:acyl-CoA thioesterase [Bacteroidales bacterium]